MEIGPDRVVSLEVELWDLHGNLLEQSPDPMLYLHGGYENLFLPVEAALEGKAVGDRIEVELEPHEGFGEYDEDLVHLVPRDLCPDEIDVGMQFEGLPGADDDDDENIYTVTDVADEVVVVDGNHPYAGIALRFIAKVMSVRDANDDEIERGFPDDPTGGVLRVQH